MQDARINITAVDKFSKVFDRLERSASKATKPLAQMTGQAGRSGLTGIAQASNALGKGLSYSARGAESLAKHFNAIDSTAQSIFSLGGALTGPLGLFAKLGGLVGGVGIKAGMDWGSVGHDASVAGKAIGISAQELLTWEAAGTKAGLAAGTMTTALQNLGNFLHSAIWDPEAQQNRDLLQTLGISIETKEGVVNTTKALQDFARVMGQITNPQTRARVADLAGIGAAMPLLQRGGVAVSNLRAAAAAEGIPGKGAEDEANRYSENVGNTKTVLRSKWRSVGSKVLGFINDDLERANAFLGVNTGGATGRWEPHARRSSGVVTDERGRPIGSGGLDGITPEAVRNLHLTAAQRAMGTSKAEIAADLQSEFAHTTSSADRTAILNEAKRHNIQINVNVGNAPPGTSVTATSTGVPVTINRTLPGVR